MTAYEIKLVELRPEMRGRVDWDTATYLYNSGKQAEQAAIQVASHNQ